jgi:pimeloyl-ACP methyl ester carboxylesterase/DNA-binding CsgD family transcriptional regulator
MPHPPQQIRFCKSRDGTRIAYATCGSGPPLVWAQYWVHHLKFDWESPVWRPWLAMLMRCHTVIRYDFRGCGLSDREGVEFSPEKLNEDLAAVIDAAGLKRFVFVGMAGGTAAGMTYAVRHPGQVSHLVLYCAQTRGRLVRSTTPEQIEEAETRLKVMSLGWLNQNPAFGEFSTSLWLPDASDEQFRSYNDLLRLTTSPTNAVKLLRAIWKIDLRDIAPHVRCPTLVLHAEQDALVPFEEGRSVAALIPGAQFVPLEGRNHVIQEHEPAWHQFVEALDRFLATSYKPCEAAVLPLHALTAREREVLEIMVEGLDNHGIAARLRISEKTVRNHVSMVFNKLGFKSRAQAVALARDAGLGHKEDR